MTDWPDTATHYSRFTFGSEHWPPKYETCAHCAMEKRNREHRAICYGAGCISCGCSDRGPCVYHKGSPRYANELKEREVAALERIAEAKS